MKDMRIVVFGGRKYRHRDRVWVGIDNLVMGWDPKAVIIIHGDADGVDTFAKEWAVFWAHAGTTHLPFPADWKNITRKGARVRHGPHGPYDVLAGFVRNQQMIDEGKPTHALQFPGGNGTADMLERIYAANRGGAQIDLRHAA